MKNLSKKLSYTLYILLVYIFIGCEPGELADKKEKTVETEKYETIDYERIRYPVKIHTLERSGMKYIIASGTYGEAGVDISNVTLDSLMVEYYKRELNAH